jgi:multidrug efflux pump subunit AcrB
VVDVDWYVEAAGPRVELAVDRDRALALGVSPELIARTLRVALAGAAVGQLGDAAAREPVPIVLRLDRVQRTGIDPLLGLSVPGAGGRMIPLRELVVPRQAERERFVYRKDLRPVSYVIAEVAGAQEFFTATSMIGFIALAGIIVRNSILLVDFVEMELARGEPLAGAVVKAGLVRFRPIALTAAALVVGGSVMLLDPIFQGLAVALISGVVVSTALTLVVIPLLYFMVLASRGAGHPEGWAPPAAGRPGGVFRPADGIADDAR